MRILTYYGFIDIVLFVKRKPLLWIKAAYRDYMRFPDGVHDVIGRALDEAQWGKKAPEAKTMSHFGSAAIVEIADDYERNTYRAVYTVEFPKAVIVLHAFQKKSKTGIKTPKSDIDLIVERRKTAKEIYEHWLEENKEK